MDNLAGLPLDLQPLQPPWKCKIQSVEPVIARLIKAEQEVGELRKQLRRMKAAKEAAEGALYCERVRNLLPKPLTPVNREKDEDERYPILCTSDRLTISLLAFKVLTQKFLTDAGRGDEDRRATIGSPDQDTVDRARRLHPSDYHRRCAYAKR